MTEINKQEVAEYWAGKIDFGPLGTRFFATDELGYDFFENVSTAPIFAHLIQEYMEGEGFSLIINSYPYKPPAHEYLYFFDDDIDGRTEHDNKFYANALAAMNALKGVKG